MHGLFLASALAFDLLLYSVPLFLIGISVLSRVSWGGEVFITPFLTVFNEFLPGAQRQFSEIFSAKRALGSGVNILHLCVLFFISANLLGTVRIITRKILATHTHLRLVRAKLLDFFLMIILGLVFGLSVVMTFTLQSFVSVLANLPVLNNSLKQVPILEGIDLLSPALLFFGVVIKLGLLVLIFYTLFRLYSDREIRQSVVLSGALVTTLLFETSKYLLGLYIHYAVSSTAIYGALGAFIFYFIWLYYCAVVFVLGASYTWAIAARQPSAKNVSY